jgi:repressor LexA
MLKFIARVQASQGAPPTVREIGRRFGIRSTNGVQYYLDLLERCGAIRRRAGRARGISLVWFTDPPGRHAPADGRPHVEDQPAVQAWQVPIIGRIAAGEPVLSNEHFDGSLDTARLRDLHSDFALRVSGDSMRDAGILDGDLVLVRQETTPRNGEIVVALIGDETTVKRFYSERGRVRLVPENPDYQTIEVTARSPELRILGRVVGVYREMAPGRSPGAATQRTGRRASSATRGAART